MAKIISLTCLDCWSNNLKPILYGYLTTETARLVGSEEIVLGGCVVTPDI